MLEHIQPALQAYFLLQGAVKVLHGALQHQMMLNLRTAPSSACESASQPYIPQTQAARTVCATRRIYDELCLPMSLWERPAGCADASCWSWCCLIGPRSSATTRPAASRCLQDFEFVRLPCCLGRLTILAVRHDAVLASRNKGHLRCWRLRTNANQPIFADELAKPIDCTQCSGRPAPCP